MNFRNLSSSNLNFSDFTLLMSFKGIIATSCTSEAQIQLLHFFRFMFLCSIYIWHNMSCYLLNINNSITFTSSLEGI